MKKLQRNEELLQLHAADKGFIYNDYSKDGKTGALYNVLHHAACSHVPRQDVKIDKYYFDNFAEATAWLRQHRGLEGKNWKRCGLFRADSAPGVQSSSAASDVAKLHVSDLQFPDDVREEGTFPEGAIRRVAVNAYERSPKAREACLEHFGYSCVVCGFNFEETYGAFAKCYIHVHHIVPLSTLGGSYEVNPINDLRPVCPNCHAAIHLEGKVRSIEKLREAISNARNIA